MFPFKSCLRRLFLFPPICLEWGFTCSPVACTRLKELPSWTCSRGEWRSADVVSYMFDVTQQRALSLEALSLRNSNTSTVTNLECLVSFRLCWLSLPSLSVSAHASQKLPGGGSERERLQELISVRGRRSSEWQLAQDCIPRHYFLCECTRIALLNVCQSMITNLKSGSDTQDNNWLCLLSLPHLRNHLNAAATAGWRLAMQTYVVFIVASRSETQLGANNQRPISCYNYINTHDCRSSNFIPLNLFSSTTLEETHGYIKALKVTLWRIRHIGLPFYLSDIGLLLNIRYQPVSVLYHRYDGCSFPNHSCVIYKKKKRKPAMRFCFHRQSLSVAPSVHLTI